MSQRKWNFVAPARQGVFSPQAHVGTPPGTFEREVGRDGFFGSATQMYHRNPPVAWSGVEGPLRPRAINPSKVVKPTSSPWEALETMHNACVRVRYWCIESSMDHLVRNSDGDELLFVHQGEGVLFCDWGSLSYEPGDYIVLPRGAMWRIETRVRTEMLLVESTGAPYSLPDRGPLGKYVPFDPGVMDHPLIDDAFRAQQGGGTWQVRVKRCQQLSVVTYPYNPLDAVGWQGDLHPVRINVRDIRSVSNHRVHMSPQTYSTFLGNRFVVCTFTPRLVETDADAMKLPFFHNNDDFEEVLFYHRGQLGSRGSVVSEGAMTLHPSGLTHGPHPEAMQYMFKVPITLAEFYTVMIDTLDPLEVPELPPDCENVEYVNSWRGHIAIAPDAKPADGVTK
ncbi:homogentisate 1,2-dioxygenase [Burkholderia sp. BCC1977]|uniref:homogentisate 1,2-dioxygenase n=1 Tax=Burkholderia sp. BCC1977 TaxID=2817440 RepID=UPI002ABE4AB0|nr:homogentisate 1,2-dioxygenase [Burkholderia sp. BCC1977]